MDHWKKIKPKLIALIVFNALVWIINSFLYPLPIVFKAAFTAFTGGGFIALVLIDIFAIEDWRGARILRNLALSAVGGAIFVGIMWMFTAYYEFPRMFQMTIIVYTSLAVLFFVVIDLKPIEAKTGIGALNSILFLFFVMSAGYTVMGWALPQFDPSYEIEKLKPKKFFIEEAGEETILSVGARVFRDYECFNCHDLEPGPIPKRGPSLGVVKMGDRNRIRESIIDPGKEASKGYEKEAKAMPDYYGQQIEKNYMEALVRYLENISKVKITTQKMPDGWWTDPKILREGYEIFEGIRNEDVACHACHGRDGIPLLEGARNLRDVKRMSELSDADIFRSVSEGIEDTEMTAWNEYLSTGEIWKAIAYINMFHHGGKAEVHAKSEVLRPIPEDQSVIPVIPE